ncbi:hypothetical protein VFPPC_18580 [Pochonia chlamydosporia 170]|uniref:Uncharacterized protein n=1 Tax=Pochonia chlamydosporia 170 TaxID=1380566 RepID=A0A219ANX9_METCM|nr:hypothetical protein VFPPC_18580 [Pochonia chlamydosporia 170]OWT42289.1 hypothetical protein VFPPC_18580 [Pochonia chlamydosporia 170]
MVSFLGTCSLISPTDSPALGSFPPSAQHPIFGSWSLVGQCEVARLGCYADSSPLVQFIADSPAHLSASSLPVATANLIVVRTAAMSGFHPSPSDSDLPPRKKDKFPILVRLYRIMPSLSEFHRVHRNRKCSTVSAAWPQLHWSVLVALILCMYLLSLHFPVRNCISILDSLASRAS